MSSGSLEDFLPDVGQITRFNRIGFTVLCGPLGPTGRAVATVVSIVSNAVALLNLMTALAGGIELGGDLTIIVKPICCLETTTNRRGDFSFVVG